MITARDLVSYVELNKSEMSDKVDTWLKDVVFPKWTKNGEGFEVPTWIKTSQLETMMGVRGFSVTFYSGYQGNFIYISLPPQND